MRVVSRTYFPFVAAEEARDVSTDPPPGTRITLTDCLDRRILNALAQHFNFT